MGYLVLQVLVASCCYGLPCIRARAGHTELKLRAHKAHWDAGGPGGVKQEHADEGKKKEAIYDFSLSLSVLSCAIMLWKIYERAEPVQ